MVTGRKKRIILVGGGSGGHVVPVFELYKKLKAFSCLEILIIGGGGDIEANIYKNIPEYRNIFSGKMHRVVTYRNIIEFIKLCLGIFQSLFVILSFRPDLVFSKGGFVSLPIVFWSKLLNKKLFAHESDIEIGMTNSYAAKAASIVFVGYPIENYSADIRNKLIYSGQLINSEFSKEKEYDFVLDDRKKTVLILGGSQGSRNINETIFSLPSETFDRYNIIHQTGLQGIEQAKKFKQTLPSELYKPYAFFKPEHGKDMMKSAFLAADIIIMRAGATTIAEAQMFNKPMILVPYKHASGDHQSKNAEILVRAKAALSISDDDLCPSKLLDLINRVADDKSLAENMIDNANKLIKKDGLSIVVREIIKELGIE